MSDWCTELSKIVLKLAEKESVLKLDLFDGIDLTPFERQLEIHDAKFPEPGPFEMCGFKYAVITTKESLICQRPRDHEGDHYTFSYNQPRSSRKRGPNPSRSRRSE